MDAERRLFSMIGACQRDYKLREFKRRSTEELIEVGYVYLAAAGHSPPTCVTGGKQEDVIYCFERVLLGAPRRNVSFLGRSKSIKFWAD